MIVVIDLFKFLMNYRIKIKLQNIFLLRFKNNFNDIYENAIKIE